MKIAILTSLVLVSSFVLGQTVTLNPTIAPTLFHYNDPITVTYDVTGTSLASLADAWVWVWIPGNTAINAKYNTNPASANAALTVNAKCIKSVVSGKTLFAITFTPSTFFASDISTQIQMGILLKGNDWSNGQTSDYISNFLIGNTFQTKLTSPLVQPLFVANGNSISVQATASAASDFSLIINNQLLDSEISKINYTRTLTVSDTVKFYQAFLIVKSGTTIDTLAFSYLIPQASPALARSSGIIDGINYNAADHTRATLCLWAPGKTSVYAFGDFTKWDVLPSYLMKKDGEHFWLEVTGLTAGTEYAFQYLVDETVRIADPYADKILDTEDSKIPATTYPALKAFPAKAVSDKWYFNRLSVLQTDQQPYQWQTTNYQKPAKEKLTIYELHIRDFFGDKAKNYQNLIDTLSYFKRLGINAIELMPITEFNGNDSWGYNPTFMFAPDKFYGTKNKLKEFIDKCHQKGIAVIMDIVMNQQDLPNPYLMMDYDFVNFNPTANNKWFNAKATHPFNVFSDLNHESPYTKSYLDTINHYWLNEYKIDGYRYDLSKGFSSINYCTTKNCDTGPEVTAWSGYDASRVAILKRMSDKVWSHTPNAYIILEHFAADQEEKELVEYRANEGKGMMVWANFNNSFNQNTMGYGSSNDISRIYFANRSWSVPGGVGYMESHDEERLMFKNLQFGNVNATYSVKSLSTALERIQAASVVFYTIPGPKMLWQFGELGYDLSINTCSDGTVNNNCRVSAKPVKWDYQQDGLRKNLHDVTADLIRLRNTHSVFTNGGATVSTGSGLIKQVALKNKPYNAAPTSSAQMNVVAVSNFDIVNQSASVNFPHTGTWYDYYALGETLSVSASPFALALVPGQYKIYTDVKIESPVITAVENTIELSVELYPNPTSAMLKIDAGNATIESLALVSTQGVRSSPSRIDSNSWEVGGFSTGMYVVEIKTDKSLIRKKIIKM
jgi:1,4-alpha-glucan branching enzyme